MAHARWAFGPAADELASSLSWLDAAHQAGDLKAIPVGEKVRGGRVEHCHSSTWVGSPGHDPADSLPHLLGGDVKWMQSAACASKPEVKFFTDRRGRSRFDDAKAVCAGCVVREDCLAFALREGMDDGVWGGHGAKARRRMEHPHPPSCVVYFAESDDNLGVVKIGTSVDVEARMAALGLAVLLVEPGSYRREAELHKQFAEYLVYGEWYRLEGALLDYVCRGLDEKHGLAETSAA